MKGSKAELLKAITGRVTDHHRFMLTQIKRHIAYWNPRLRIYKQAFSVEKFEIKRFQARIARLKTN